MNGENSHESPSTENQDSSEQPTPPEPLTPMPTERGHESKEVRIARICHQAIRAYCEATDDDSHVIWDEAPTKQKESELEGVRFHINHPNASASAGHERWLENKRQDGWKYGKVKNEESREHPCFLPFVDLPKEQKAKDFIFKAIVNSLT